MLVLHTLTFLIDNKRMNENPRMLVVFCLEKYSIANHANILANMLVQMLPNVLPRFAGAFMSALSKIAPQKTITTTIRHAKMAQETTYLFEAIIASRGVICTRILHEFM